MALGWIDGKGGYLGVFFVWVWEKSRHDKIFSLRNFDKTKEIWIIGFRFIFQCRAHEHHNHDFFREVQLSDVTLVVGFQKNGWFVEKKCFCKNDKYWYFFLSVCKKNKTWVIRLQGLFRQIGNSFSYIQFVKIITSTDNKKWQNCLLMWMRLVPLKRLV